MRSSRLTLVAALVGCTQARGMWRDQYVFIGDDGDVMAMVLQRDSDGTAEAKAWLGRSGRWEAIYFDRFPIHSSQARDPIEALGALSLRPGRRVRATLERDRGVRIRLRMPSVSIEVRAPSTSRLGSHRDPEGLSRYAAGRAIMRVFERDLGGQLLLEETPSDSPRRPFVDFGELVFLLAANPRGEIVVLKDSMRRSGFDYGITQWGGALARTTRLRTTIDVATIAFQPAGQPLTRLSIRDRDASRGVSPSGKAVQYEALLLGGDYSGVAFTIGAAQGRARAETDP